MTTEPPNRERIREAIRKLPEHLFDLLGEAERTQLESDIAGEPRIRLALERQRSLALEWGDTRGLATGDCAGTLAKLEGTFAGEASTMELREVLGHVLTCPECGFSAAILLAELEDPSKVDSTEGTLTGSAGSASHRPPTVHFLSPSHLWARTAIGLAAAVLLVFAGTFIERSSQLERPDEGAILPFEIASFPVRLNTERGSTDPVRIILSDLSEMGITFLAEARVPGPGATWTIVERGSENVVSKGMLSFRPESPALRSIAVFVPRELFQTGVYLFDLRTLEGAAVRQWPFTVMN